MGASESKSSMANTKCDMNTMISNATTDVVVKHTAIAQAVAKKLTISGKVMRPTTLKLAVLKKAGMNSTVREEMANTIIDSIEKYQVANASPGDTRNNIRIHNVVRKSVDSSFSQDSMEKLALLVDLDKEISFTSGGLTVTQLGGDVSNLVSNMSKNITDELLDDNIVNIGHSDNPTMASQYGASAVVLANGLRTNAEDVMYGIIAGVDQPWLTPMSLMCIIFIFSVIVGCMSYMWKNRSRQPPQPPQPPARPIIQPPYEPAAAEYDSQIGPNYGGPPVRM
jgi:hypothetical protein